MSEPVLDIVVDDKEANENRLALCLTHTGFSITVVELVLLGVPVLQALRGGRPGKGSRHKKLNISQNIVNKLPKTVNPDKTVDF